MKSDDMDSKRGRQATRVRERGSTRVFAILGVVAVAVIALALLRGSGGRTGGASGGSEARGGGGGGESGSSGSGAVNRPRPRLVTQSGGGGGGQQAPEAVVADKVVRFSQSRRQLAETLAQRFNVTLPPDVDRFFSAVEAGDWRDIKSLFNSLSAYAGAADTPKGFASVWPALQETYAAAEAKVVWPPDQLLSYGQTVLAAMKPGMAYVGGSKWGSAIPSLMSETSGQDSALVLDHSQLSNPGYLEYLGAVYGDRISVVSNEEVQKSRNAYFAELAERAKNNQLRPGESVPTGDNRELKSGSTGGTDVSERLLLALLEKNPGLSVAVEKPTPGSALYEHAVPMGPIFEIQAPGAAAAFSQSQAEQTVRFWRDAVTQVQAMGESEEGQVTRRSMAEMAISQAAYLANRSMTAEAEQTYRSAMELAPTILEPVGEYAQYLQNTGRAAEARQVLDDYAKRFPDEANGANYFKSRLAEGKR